LSVATLRVADCIAMASTICAVSLLRKRRGNQVFRASRHPSQQDDRREVDEELEHKGEVHA
jgi:hypothetical protein